MAELSSELENRLPVLHAELGLMGRLFGLRDNAIVYCAGLCGLPALGAYVALLFALSDGSSKLDVAAKSLPPIVLAVLGYLFGRARAER
ncbi:MAG: hypothetical protein FJX36_08495 [Alphaproteobacteria bacterium]|nr:hypothetical protein [Alphaproteobacteria bacterium]